MRPFGLAAAVALLGAAAPGALRHATGPPPGHTGGFGEPSCVLCHEGDEVNAFGGSVAIHGLPDGYAGGEPYVLTVLLEAPETGVAGFQMAARYAGGSRQGEPAGVLRGLDPRVTVTQDESGQPYAHQTALGTAVASSRGSSWSVEWTAPLEGGTVAFHVAANSGNGDNSPLMDLVYTSEATIPPR